MIYQLIARVKHLLRNDSDLSELENRIYQVDDLDGYDDFIKQYPAVGIYAGREAVVYREDTREVQHVITPLAIRVYTRCESSPEAARKAVGILTWKVLNVLRKNPRLKIEAFGETEYLIDSEPNAVLYGSRRKDRVFDEYGTIEYNTQRPEVEPESDEEYYDVIQTMLRVSCTGMGGGYEER